MRFSLIKISAIILSKWPWLLAFLILGLLFARFYLYFNAPVFLTTASMKIEEKHSELSDLLTTRNFYDRSNKRDAEKFIIRSRTVLQHALRSLHLEVSFYKKIPGGFSDLYPRRFFKIKICKRLRPYASAVRFCYKRLDNNQFQLWNFDEPESKKILKYGCLIQSKHLWFKVYQNGSLDTITHLFGFNDENDLIETTSRSFRVDESETGNIINLRFANENPLLAQNLLNAIIRQYLHLDKTERSSSLKQTEYFIDGLRSKIGSEMDNSGKYLQDFKVNHHFTDVSLELPALINELNDVNKENQVHSLQNKYIAQLKTALERRDSTINLHSKLQGLYEPQLAELLQRYNEGVFEKQSALEIFTPEASQIQKINEKLNLIESAIRRNIDFQGESQLKKTAFFIQKKDSIRRYATIEFPRLERDYITLKSKHDIDRKIFNYLTEKKLEAQISKAAVVPAATVIDWAFFPKEPISPISERVYTISLLCSILIASIIIFLIRYFNPYLYNRETIESLTVIPVIGVARKYVKGPMAMELPVLSDRRSIFAESIRAIRGRLNFFAPEKKCKVVCITSEISGEGKSFLSLNIAASLALLNKKTLLIATDLRRSYLHESLNTGNAVGLSMYLSGQSSCTEIFHETQVPFLTFIPSGPAPPNPSELLASHRMTELIKDAEHNYDFIIMDTAPVGIVSDGKPLLRIADINLYIFRCGVSRQQFVNNLEAIRKDFNLSNLSIILNDFQENRFQTPYYYQGGSRRHNFTFQKSYEQYNKER